MGLSEAQKKALVFFAQKLKEFPIQWVLVGSANLALQGVKINVNDINIATNNDDIFHIKNIFCDYCLGGITRSKQDADILLCKLKIYGIDILILGDSKSKIYTRYFGTPLIEKRYFLGEWIPCLDLEMELRNYRLVGMKDKVDVLKEFLK